MKYMIFVLLPLANCEMLIVLIVLKTIEIASTLARALKHAHSRARAHFDLCFYWNIPWISNKKKTNKQKMAPSQFFTCLSICL